MTCGACCGTYEKICSKEDYRAMLDMSEKVLMEKLEFVRRAKERAAKESPADKDE
jgi:hypothetical protein